jgi:thioredoxin 1
MKLFRPTLRKAAPAVLAIAALTLFTSCGPREAANTAPVDDKHVITLTKDNFQTEVLASTQPVLVDFWAVWCGPCKMVAPIVAELATEFEGQAKVGKVDVDTQEELSKQYEISAIPSLLIFKDGKVVDQVVGVRPKAELKAKLERFITDAAPASTTPKS